MAKNRYKWVKKVFPISLGPGDRAFEPHYSDQNPSEIVDFRGIFLILCLLRRKIYGYIVECRLKNMSKNHIISLIFKDSFLCWMH